MRERRMAYGREGLGEARGRQFADPGGVSAENGPNTISGLGCRTAARRSSRAR